MRTGEGWESRWHRGCGLVWVYWYPGLRRWLVRRLHPRLARALDAIHDDVQRDMSASLRRPRDGRDRREGEALPPESLRTPTGRVLTDDDIAELAREAEEGYPVDELRGTRELDRAARLYSYEEGRDDG